MKKLSLIFIFFLFALVVVFFGFVISISRTKNLPSQEEVNIVDIKKLDKLEKINSPTQNANTNVSEPGFGRENPFAPI